MLEDERDPQVMSHVKLVTEIEKRAEVCALRESYAESRSSVAEDHWGQRRNLCERSDVPRANHLCLLLCSP